MPRRRPQPPKTRPPGLPVGWHLTVYPEAREAVGVFRATSSFQERERVSPGQSRDPERSRRVASGRAKAKIRRCCVANGLNRLGTLTYEGEGCHDPVQLRADLADFFVRLRRLLDGGALPYLWVPEWHHTDHGLHAHFGVGQFVKRSLIEEAWGRGYVHIKLLGDLPVGSTAADEARRAAGYFAKYVGKDVDEDRLGSLHRYEVAEGFQPRSEKVYGRHLEDAAQLACELIGELPKKQSTSDSWPNWSGPTAVAMSW